MALCHWHESKMLPLKAWKDLNCPPKAIQLHDVLSLTTLGSPLHRNSFCFKHILLQRPPGGKECVLLHTHTPQLTAEAECSTCELAFFQKTKSLLQVPFSAFFYSKIYDLCSLFAFGWDRKPRRHTLRGMEWNKQERKPLLNIMQMSQFPETLLSGADIFVHWILVI